MSDLHELPLRFTATDDRRQQASQVEGFTIVAACRIFLFTELIHKYHRQRRHHRHHGKTLIITHQAIAG